MPAPATCGHQVIRWINGAAFEEKPMKDILIMLAIVGAWYLLQAYILPKLGVST